MFELDKIDNEIITMEIPLGTPNTNGRIYVTDNFVGDGDVRDILVVLDVPEGVLMDLSRVVGKVDAMTIGADAVIVEWHLVETPMGKVAKSLREANVKMRLSPAGTGKIGTDGVVSDYILSCFALISR
jgi:hypothetical protein